jgi:hypothetical protein
MMNIGTKVIRRGTFMTALVTLENGQMFKIDMHGLILTAIDELGNPISTKPLQRLPVAVPGHQVAFAFGDGIETTKDKVATVIYCR